MMDLPQRDAVSKICSRGDGMTSGFDARTSSKNFSVKSRMIWHGTAEIAIFTTRVQYSSTASE